ncbi:calcineurin B homologous protein 1 [Hyalella azteca]|uniref:Calcineurin B homologous protein 1 n=1 Tax=Hyalella azteca TaxID=294128 RepID=A0A8B7NXX2_HYAAZ|nr:calcineurin B homologous protein 1 [Hyalella azteca]
MGNKHSLMLQDSDIKSIQADTGFSASQIERLYSRFTSLDKGNSGSLSREDFLRIPELAINPLGDRIVHAFFQDNTTSARRAPHTSDCWVNFKQFVRVLAHFRPIKRNQENKLNSREEKLRFAFKMYDLDDDGSITRDEVLAVLHMMVGENISEDQLISIAERTMLEADVDNNQMITFQEFCTILERTDVEQKMSIKFLK